MPNLSNITGFNKVNDQDVNLHEEDTSHVALLLYIGVFLLPDINRRTMADKKKHDFLKQASIILGDNINNINLDCVR